jgi:hypothetical protein
MEQTLIANQACRLSVLFFPKAAISINPKAGLLTYSTFCGLPIRLRRTVANLQVAKSSLGANSIG